METLTTVRCPICDPVPAPAPALVDGLTTTVIHCDICDARHADVELAIRCCGAMHVCFYYECSLCHRFFEDKATANNCADYHLRMKDIRKNEMVKYDIERV